MSSPFTTLEQFNNAIDGPTEGAIYTFANSPAVNGIALVIAAALFLWFVATTFSTYGDESVSSDRSQNGILPLIVTGLLSIVALESLHNRQHIEQSKPVSLNPISHLQIKAMGILGLAGTSAPSIAYASEKLRKSKRLNRRYKELQSRKYATTLLPFVVTLLILLIGVG